jgi:hypothetical protein
VSPLILDIDYLQSSFRSRARSGQLIIAVTFDAIPGILALVRLRISRIFAIAFQAFTVLPTSARLIVLTSFRFGFANLTVF